jgi:hypothetical protein
MLDSKQKIYFGKPNRWLDKARVGDLSTEW